MNRLARHIIIFTVVTLCGVSCKLDDLCYDHSHYPYVEVSVDLSSTEGIAFSTTKKISKPTEDSLYVSYLPLTFSSDLLSYKAIFYPVDDGIIDIEDLDNNIQEFRMQNAWDFKFSVIPGTYDILLYSDYSGQITFSNILEYDNIFAQAITSKQLSSVRANDEGLVAMPDQMVVGQVNNYIVEDLGTSANDDSYNNPQPLEFTGVQATKNVVIKFWIINSNSISTLSAYVGEVDSKYYISSQSSSDGGYDMITYDDNLHYNSYSETYVVNKEESGNLESYTNTSYYREYIIDAITFGMSEGSDHFVYFDITLKDGSTWESGDDVTLYNFDDATIEYSSNNTTTYVFGSQENPAMTLPEMISSDTGDGGFSMGVGDWEDETNFEVTLK